MSFTISFHGAARNVTGSKYLVENGKSRVLVDCGMYQERNLRDRNWNPFVFDPPNVDAVVLTHGHLDHCGLLPKLVNEGFKGRIVCTSATADISKIVIEDSGHIQEEDAKYKKKRHEREGRKGKYPEKPLYTAEDARNVFPLFQSTTYNREVEVAPGVSVTFRDAGHILGSSILEMKISDGKKTRKIVFSGDLGRWDKPILEDPTMVSEADYVVCESTYGDREHEPIDESARHFDDIVTSTIEAGGRVVIPTFAIERSQELLYELSGMMYEGRIPKVQIFFDSPMAIRVSDVFEKHPELFDDDMAELVRKKQSPFNLPFLEETRSTAASKAINDHPGPCIIMAGSGMCTGGRVKHHIVQNIHRPESTLLFVGYQAVGTLGRILRDGADSIRLFGRNHEVKMRIEQINGFSGHADKNELLKWLDGFKSPVRRLFITHGEQLATAAFSVAAAEATGWDVAVPDYHEVMPLD